MSRTPEDIQDELLVADCQHGDRAALRTLIARWQPRLLRLAWRLTSEREAARDITQDAWLAIVSGLRRLDDPALFRSWVYRIVANKCTDWTRRNIARRKATADWQNAATLAADGSDNQANDEVRTMRALLSTLSDEQRVILALHHLDGLGIAEIALVLNIPAGTVKSRLFHARCQLKQAIERNES